MFKARVPYAPTTGGTHDTNERILYFVVENNDGSAVNVKTSSFFSPMPGDLTSLTRERVTKIAGPRKQLILTFVNHVRLDFARTWVAHVRRLSLTNWLVGATDEGALQGLMRERTPCFSMKTNLPQGEWDWGSPNFKALGLHKVALIHTALTWGVAIVITDIDALVLREPFGYMERWPDASFLTTSDHLGNTTGSRDGGLEDHGATSSAFNIGYMYFNISALPLVKVWRDAMFARNRWDQGEFNSLVRSGMRLQRDEERLADPRLFRCFGGHVVGGVLPLALFAGGHHHFVSAMAHRLGVQPYSVHTTFQYGGAPGKRHRLREGMLWEEADEGYYAPAGGVLAYDADVPDRLLRPKGGMTAKGHIELMLHQLRQLRVALALSYALGRVLVLPQLACGFDKYWAPIGAHGMIPSAPSWAAPIGGPNGTHGCPLDHLLNPAELKPEPTRYVREYSFLQNPKLHIEFAPSTAFRTAVQLASGSSEMRRLREASSKKVLWITNLPMIADALWQQGEPYRKARDAEGGMHEARRGLLLAPRTWRGFKRTFARLQGGWCCAPTGQSPRAAGFHVMNSV